MSQLEARRIPSIHEMIPTYKSLLIIYDPEISRYREMVDILKGSLSVFEAPERLEAVIIEIPTL